MTKRTTLDFINEHIDDHSSESESRSDKIKMAGDFYNIVFNLPMLENEAKNAKVPFGLF